MNKCISINRIFLILLLGLTILVSCSKKTISPKPPTPPPTSVDSTKKDVPSGATDGVTFINNGTSAIFDLYAPGKSSVYVIGDFNNWTASVTYKMINSTDGSRWWVEVDNLDPTKEYAYQYYIDGSLKVADPYAHKILDPNNDKYIPASVYPNLKAYPAGQTGIVSVMQAQPTAYNWQATNFQRPNPKNLVVYELLVRDFVATHDYRTLTDTLDYIARLGVNAIELLPVNEFEGNDSWGYNTNFMFALDKYYGTPNDYKAFIDACHARGIAVIQDIVLEDQFGSSPLAQMYWNPTTNTPTQKNPWLDSIMTHPYGVGYQLNYQKPATVNFAKDVLKYWVKEYHIDGYRFDQANGFTETNSNGNNSAKWTAYDAERVQNLTNLNTYLKSLDPSLYLILEEFAEPKEVDALAKEGMISWNNQNSAGTQAAMGYAVGPTWDLSSMSYKNFGITEPTGLMTYVESHDEVRVQFKNGQYGNSNGAYSVKNLMTGLQRDGMLATFLFTVPGPKMIWMFGERGYDDATTGPDYDNLNGSSGSKRLSDQPPLWNYMQDPNRAALYNTYSTLIHFKTNNPVFTTANFTVSLNGAVKWIQLIGTDGTNVEVIGNFDVVPQTANITFPSTGTWYDNLGTSNLNVPTLTIPITLAPGEYHVYSNSKLVE